MSTLQFLKLGGSLITDKTIPHTPRLDVIQRLADEIADARREDPQLSLILGHGSGSFGHVPARRYGTRQGVQTPQAWQGFVEVWREAQALNRLVMDALARADVPAIALPPLSSILAKDGQVLLWELGPLRGALQAGLMPVIYGDVIFDTVRGGTILSTEDLFAYLVGELLPGRILLAGIEPGVWIDYPRCTRLLDLITPADFMEIAPALSGSSATDVTGGMASKVALNLDLVQNHPGLEVRIFSGETPGILAQALAGAPVGTLICNRFVFPLNESI